MKKAIVLIVALAMVLSLAGCGRPSEMLESLAVTTTAIPTVTVTFPEGMTVPEYAGLLEENGVCSAESFISACRTFWPQYEFLNDIKNPQERPFLLEGYLFPDTYEFYLNMDAMQVVPKFLDNFATKLTRERLARISEMGYTPDQVLALASIIQEEAVPETMKEVSSVLHNRLEDPNAKLQCDVTISYLNDSVAPYFDSIDAYSENYNCYKRVGLPAGPITNVGIEAIDAALYPADTDYYFFLTDENGDFHFAVTWEEHERNVAKYIK